MASNLATIRVELIANAQKFKKNLDQGAQGLKKLDKATAKTTKGSKKMQEGLRNVAGSIAAVQGPLGPVAGRISSIGAIMGRVSIAGLALTAGLVAVGAGFTKLIRAGTNFESQQLKIAALLKATGGAAMQTGTDIEEMAVKIGRGTLASVQGARDAAGVLLTFKSISGDTFGEVLKLTQDLAAVGFGTMKTAALQLGKALEEPEIGLSALRRVGVSFTESQKEQIKVLSLTGRQAEAQALILKALKEQVGGAGEGAAGGLAGAFDTLGENITLFFEKSEMGQKIVQGLTTAVNFLADAFGKFVPDIRELPSDLEGLQKALKDTDKEMEAQAKVVIALNEELEKMGQVGRNNADQKKDLVEEIRLEQKKLETLSAHRLRITENIDLQNKQATAVNKAGEISAKHLRKRTRGLEDELRLSTAISEKQKFIVGEQIKLRTALISKLGDSADAMKAINEIMAIQQGHFEAEARVMVAFREELAQVDKIATGVANEISKVGDTIVDAFLRGKAGALDFKNILRELIISIQKTIIQTLILDEVNKFVKNSIKGIFNPTANVGGRVLSPGDGMAGGGTVQAGKPTLVGERGPELFVPNTSGAIKNNADTKQMVGGGGGINVTQNLNFAVGVTNTVRAEVMNMLPAIQQSTVQAVAEAKQRGGKFSKAFGS
tara:strand:- start:1827 stop:3818 length:1992 start_codon:yes stop_codon:yes gene_type:complete